MAGGCRTGAVDVLGMSYKVAHLRSASASAAAPAAVACFVSRFACFCGKISSYDGGEVELGMSDDRSHQRPSISLDTAPPGAVSGREPLMLGTKELNR